MQVDYLMTQLISDSPTYDDLKIVQATCTTKEKKLKLSNFIIENTDKIFNVLVSSPSHEVQLLMLKIIEKTLLKKQVLASNIFRDVTSRYSGNKQDAFLIQLNYRYNHNVVGCLFSSMKCVAKSLNLMNGTIFLTRDSLKLYSSNDTVVLYDENIILIEITNTKIVIKAKENRTVELTLPKDEYSYVFITKVKFKYKKIIKSSDYLSKIPIKCGIESNKVTCQSKTSDNSFYVTENDLSISINSTECRNFKEAVEKNDIKTNIENLNKENDIDEFNQGKIRKNASGENDTNKISKDNDTNKVYGDNDTKHKTQENNNSSLSEINVTLDSKKSSINNESDNLIQSISFSQQKYKFNDSSLFSSNESIPCRRKRKLKQKTKIPNIRKKSKSKTKFKNGRVKNYKPKFKKTKIFSSKLIKKAQKYFNEEYKLLKGSLKLRRKI